MLSIKGADDYYLKIPEKQLLVFDCGELGLLYKHHLKDYLGIISRFVNFEKILMGELYYRLENVYPEDCMPLDIALKDVFIPTDIKEAFFIELDDVLTCIIFNLDFSLKNKLLIDLSIRNGYTLIATIMIGLGTCQNM